MSSETKKSLNSGGYRSAGQLQLIVHEVCVLSVKTPSKLNIVLSLGLTHEIKKRHWSNLCAKTDTAGKRRRKLAVLFLPPLEIPPSAARR